MEQGQQEENRRRGANGMGSGDGDPSVRLRNNDYEIMQQSRQSNISDLSADAPPYLQRAESSTSFTKMCGLCRSEIFTESKKYVDLCVDCRPRLKNKAIFNGFAWETQNFSVLSFIAPWV